MELEKGWLIRQLNAAAAEVKTWSRSRKERMFCSGGHHWSEPLPVSETQEIQQCECCGRQRVKFNWAEEWVFVIRGKEISYKEFTWL
jgi:hypothetical protein